MASTWTKAKPQRDKEVEEGEQGLLLFAPNLQSFGALPKNGNFEGTFSQPYVDERANFSGKLGGTFAKSDEDVDLSDDERTNALAHDDSLDRATATDQSIRNIAERNITKVSSTRQLHDQGGEGFSPMKDVESLQNQQRRLYSRNETFAGSRTYLGSQQSIQSSAQHLRSTDTLKSENYLPAVEVSFQLSRTEAEHILSSGLIISANALSQLTTLCKDVSMLLVRRPLGSETAPETRQSLEGLLQVLKWRVDNAITPYEFNQIYKEWLKAHGQTGPLSAGLIESLQERSSNQAKLQRVHFEENLIDLLQIGTRYSNGNLAKFVSELPRMIELLRSEFNTQLLTEKIVDDLWIQVVERLYAQLDFEQGHLAGCGSLNSDRMQFFLLTLLLNEITAENWSRIPEIVSKQTQALMTNMRHLGGFVTLRDFKMYLLFEGVRSQTDIQVLYEHFEIVIKTQRRVFKKRKEGTEEGMAWKVYQNVKKLIGQDQATATAKQLIKSGNFANCLALSSIQSLSLHSQQTINKALTQSGSQISIFDFHSASLDEELEKTLTLVRYVLTKAIVLANESSLMQGTHLSEANVEALKRLLVSDLKAKDSFCSELEPVQLASYFSTLLTSYMVRNKELLHDMCEYLNSHISVESTLQQSEEKQGKDSCNQSEVFSLHQFDSNNYSAQNEVAVANNEDSRPSFGNSYVNNFIRQEEQQRSVQKSPFQMQQHTEINIAMFGDSDSNANLQESSIKMQYQEDSSLTLQQIALEESEQNVYSTQPMKQGTQDAGRDIIVKKAPNTTKHSQGSNHNSVAILSKVHVIDEYQEQSQFEQAPEERLPKFKINLQELHHKSLNRRQAVQELAFEESTGIGLMLSKREVEVQKLPRPPQQRTGRTLIKVSKGYKTPEEQQSKVLGEGQSSQKKQQRVQDPKTVYSMKHTSNVKSISDVLSNLSKSPKFNAKMIGNDSNPLLSIDSPNKFIAGSITQSNMSKVEEEKSILSYQAYQPADEAEEQRKRAQSALTFYSGQDALLREKSSALIITNHQQQATDTPSFSFQDQGSSNLFSNHNMASTQSHNQTQFSMKTDGTLVKSLNKNTQSMHPLRTSMQLYQQQKKDWRQQSSDKGSSAQFSDHLRTQASNYNMHKTHIDSPKSAMTAFQKSNLGALVPSLTKDRSAFLSSISGRLQKVKRSTSQTLQAHISKSSLRRIEPYEEVLRRLKVSVKQVLAASRGRSREKSGANPAQLQFIESLEGLTSKTGKGLLMQKSQQKIQRPSQHTKGSSMIEQSASVQAMQQSQFFISSHHSGFQTASEQIAPKVLHSSFSVPYHSMVPDGLPSRQNRGARVTQYQMGGRQESPSKRPQKVVCSTLGKGSHSRSRNKRAGSGRRGKQINNLELNRR